jgi:hypothetical protein
MGTTQPLSRLYRASDPAPSPLPRFLDDQVRVYISRASATLSKRANSPRQVR